MIKKTSLLDVLLFVWCWVVMSEPNHISPPPEANALTSQFPSSPASRNFSLLPTSHSLPPNNSPQDFVGKVYHALSLKDIIASREYTQARCIHHNHYIRPNFSTKQQSSQPSPSTIARKTKQYAWTILANISIAIWSHLSLRIIRSLRSDVSRTEYIPSQNFWLAPPTYSTRCTSRSSPLSFSSLSSPPRKPPH